MQRERATTPLIDGKAGNNTELKIPRDNIITPFMSHNAMEINLQ